AEDRNRIAALDHAVDMAQRLQELRAFDRNLHCTTRPIPKETQIWKSRAAGRAPRHRRPRKAGSSSRYDQSRQGRARWLGWPPDSRDWGAVPHNSHDFPLKTKAVAQAQICSLAPFLRGEGWGEGPLSTREIAVGPVPPHPNSICDRIRPLPQAG